MLIYVLGVAAAAYVTWGLFIFFMQSRLLYSPVRDVAFTPRDLGLEFEDVVFLAEDGVELNGWHVPAAQSEPTVLLCHGNGGNVGHCLDSVKLLHELGLNCFVFDYRGYGKSKGKCSEQGTYADVKAAYRWLTEEKGVAGQDIIAFGRSLGGTIAAYLAAETDVKAAVIESAFTSYADIGQRLYRYLPVRPFARYRYDTLEYVKRMECPVMFVYSKNDEVVPFDFGLRLYEAAGGPKEFVEITGGHNGAYLASEDVYRDAWVRWLDMLKGGSETRQHLAS